MEHYRKITDMNPACHVIHENLRRPATSDEHAMVGLIFNGVVAKRRDKEFRLT
jgi:hypothetical protein